MLPPYDDTRIELKSRAEIEVMRAGGRIVGEILYDLTSMTRPGITTWDLEVTARKRFSEKKARPAFMGYKGFPAALCTSINEEVVHGIPSPRRVLKSGDILKIDVGLYYKGFYTDVAVSIPVGEVNEEKQRLLNVARGALRAGIDKAKAGNRLGDISHAIQILAEEAGFSVVREYTGHGIGRHLHESPQIPNFGPEGSGPRLKPGMVFALEPMVNAGTWETRVLGDDWTVVTADGRCSAHFEHTVAIMEEGSQILTDYRM
jgi:methionyl aminopeptidase